jgi:DNA polymerase IV (DinB-like DNA polymerase)
MHTLRSYAGEFEQVGIDEAYLDVTREVNNDFDVSVRLAQRMKLETRELHKISFSIGIGPNKVIAKIACDVQKPDGLTVVRPDEVASFLQNLPVDRLLGVGRKTAQKMEQLEIRTIGDLSRFDVQRLVEVFGKSLGQYFHNASRGIDDEPVRESTEAESISRIATLKEDTRDLSIILERSNQLASDVHKELIERNLHFKQVGIMAILTDLNIRSRSKTLGQPSDDLETINRVVRDLFERFVEESNLDLRRVGVKVSGFVKEQTSQRQLTSFFVSQ